MFVGTGTWWDTQELLGTGGAGKEVMTQNLTPGEDATVLLPRELHVERKR